MAELVRERAELVLKIRGKGFAQKFPIKRSPRQRLRRRESALTGGYPQ